jgi:hypothetical protein
MIQYMLAINARVQTATAFRSFCAAARDGLRQRGQSRLLERVLSQDDITALYNSGAGMSSAQIAGS